MLDVNNIEVIYNDYNDVILAVKGISLKVLFFDFIKNKALHIASTSLPVRRYRCVAEQFACLKITCCIIIVEWRLF